MENAFYFGLGIMVSAIAYYTEKSRYGNELEEIKTEIKKLNLTKVRGNTENVKT